MTIYGITGYKQAGKDTVYDYMRRMYLPRCVERLNFADPVKQEVALACGTTVTNIEARKSEFRPVLQWWGTDFRRRMHGDGYWLIKWLLKARTMHPDVLFCTDVRFLNEAAILKELGGILIRVKNNRVKSDGHASETEQDLIICDYTIENNGSIQDLEKEIKLKIKL